MRRDGHRIQNQKKLKYCLFFCLMLCVVFSCYIATQADEKKNVIRLYPPGAYNIKTHEDRDHGTSSISFQIKLTYPSKAVLEFYDKELKELGWEKFAEPSYLKSYEKWISFVDATTRGDPLVHQLMASWADRERSKRVILALRYYSYGLNKKVISKIKNPKNNIQCVTLQIMPFSELPKENW